MDLEGFDLRADQTDAGETVLEFRVSRSSARRFLKVRFNETENLIVELIENGGVAELFLGERVTSPINSPELAGRLLRAMAFLHLDTRWVEDSYTLVDVEMVKRGYNIGRLQSGELIWYSTELGSTFIVSRENSYQLPDSYDVPARLTLIGVTGMKLVLGAVDYRSLVQLMESGLHYEMYNPHHNIHIPGLYMKDGHTTH
jgi:hypothetical protein